MKKQIIYFFLACMSIINALYGRSPFRKQEKNIPTVTTSWQKNTKTYTKKSRYFHENPLFTIFNHDDFIKHLLPNTNISYRWNPENSVEGEKLTRLIQNLYEEVLQGKTSYTDFTILQTKNFNRKQKCGLLVVKFKKYPFVVKLFLETPKTLIDPYCKGFENRVFHFMGHGANRHLSGLTRIPNLKYIETIISEHDTWKNRIILPRKWYWKPKKFTMIAVRGKNFGNNKTLHTTIPSVYAIVADELDTSIKSPISIFEHHKIVLQLCNDMQLLLDPHLDNFILDFREKGPFKIQIVDTEHFPTIVGIHYKKVFKNYFQWYGYLSCKAVNDLYLQTKKHRSEKLHDQYIFPWQTEILS